MKRELSIRQTALCFVGWHAAHCHDPRQSDRAHQFMNSYFLSVDVVRRVLTCVQSNDNACQDGTAEAAKQTADLHLFETNSTSRQ